MIKGGHNTASMSAQFNGIRVNSSAYGKTVKNIWGMSIAEPDIIWNNDWQKSSRTSNMKLAIVTGQNQSGGGGKKGGKGSKKGGGTPEYYSAAIDFLLGHAPILGVLTTWYNNQRFNVAKQSATGVISGGAFSFSPGATLAGIITVTVSEAFSETFDDFGGSGAVTESGTWERPLWNAAFAVPGRIDADAFRARDPYTWWWNGVNATVYVPAELEGKTVTVHYGVPVITKSDGSFFSHDITPIALLNLEFETQLAQGSEYTNHENQRVKQNWCAGLGSTRFDLGMANAVSNLNFECVGAFTLWPNGDCDVADIITDIVTSGPVLVGA